MAQDEDSVCKARVRILLYERFPRFRPRSRRAPRVSRGSGGLMGFRRIKGVADRIKAGDISSARYPAVRLFHVNYVKFARVSVDVGGCAAKDRQTCCIDDGSLRGPILTGWIA